MTTTLALTPDAATASVLVQAATDAAGLTLTRSDQNGTVPVRLLAGQGAGQQLAVRDHEPALVGPVIYTCTTTEPVELRRNRFANPSAATTTGFTSAASQATVTKEGSAVRFTLAGVPAVAIGVMPPSGSFQSGDAVRMLLRARASRDLAPKGRFGQSAAAEFNVEALTTEWKWIEVSAPAAANPSGTNWGLVLRASAVTWAPGDWVEIDRVLYAAGSDTGEWFDGSSAGAEWTGAENGSASVIRGIESVERQVRFDQGEHEVAADVASIVAQPQWRARGRLTLDVQLERPSRSIRHDILDRPDPVFTLRKGGFRTGAIEVLALDWAAVEAFDALVAQSGIVQLRHAALSPGQRLVGDLYAHINRVAFRPEQGTAPWRFRVTLGIEEVRRPTSPLLGSAVWTYDDLAAVPATYGTLPALFATYADLAAGVSSDA